MRSGSAGAVGRGLTERVEFGGIYFRHETIERAKESER